MMGGVPRFHKFIPRVDVLCPPCIVVVVVVPRTNRDGLYSW